MRQLLRNCRTVWYASLLSETDGKDSNGYDTLETVQSWSEPKSDLWCVSGAAGEWAVQAFGGFCDFTRTISITGDCPLSVGDRVWIGRTPPQHHNYEVVRVADGLFDHLVAVREVPG